MPDAPDPGRKPDAILFPVGWEPPGSWTGGNRIDRLSRHFEAVLGAVPGQTAHVRDVGNQQVLVSLSPTDTLLHPDDHRHAKFPRYDWTEAPGGLRHGTLKPDDTRK